MLMISVESLSILVISLKLNIYVTLSMRAIVSLVFNFIVRLFCMFPSNY